MTRPAAATLLFLSYLGLALGQVDFLGAPCSSDVCDNGMQCLEVTSGSPCSVEGLLSDRPCTCGGVGGETDPYFTGFSGQSFYFVAEADTTYNIFSEQAHQLNAAFVATELPPESDLIAVLTGAKNSSFIGTLALQYFNSTVEITADRSGDIALLIDGESISIDSEKIDMEETIDLGNGLTVTLEQFPMVLGTTVKVETPLMTICTYPTAAHEDNLGNLVRGHLNLHLSLKVSRRVAPPAHGILGQTLVEDMGIDMAAPDAFPGEGDAKDYVVSSLFGTDFAYNMFNTENLSQVIVKQPVARQATSRRMLIVKQEQASESLQASFGTQGHRTLRRQ